MTNELSRTETITDEETYPETKERYKGIKGLDGEL